MQTTIGIIELNLARITYKLSKILVDHPVYFSPLIVRSDILNFK